MEFENALESKIFKKMACDFFKSHLRVRLWKGAVNLLSIQEGLALRLFYLRAIFNGGIPWGNPIE